jgi:hypothetical protein
MRPRGREHDAERVGEVDELRTTLGDPGRRVGPGLAAAGADLHLGRDQLTDEVLLERRALRRGLELLEAVDEVVRDRVEHRELLLDGDGEVAAVVIGVARRPDQLVVRQPLLVAHEGHYSS